MRWFGTGALGTALILLANANLLAVAFELVASEKVIKVAQTNLHVRRAVTQAAMWVSIALAAAAAGCALVSRPASMFILAVLMSFAQYAANVLYIASGRPHFAHYLTLLISCARLTLIAVCAFLGRAEDSLLVWIYVGSGAAVYCAGLALELLRRVKPSAVQPPVRFGQALRGCVATPSYLSMVASKKIRESSLGLLGTFGILSEHVVAYVSLSYKGANFVFGHLRVLEVALMNRQHYAAYTFSRQTTLLIGIAGAAASAVFCLMYLAASGVAPLPIVEPMLFSAMAVPIANNQRFRLAAFHTQSFRKSAVANFTSALAMLLTPFLFLSYGMSGAVGYAAGCLMAEASVPFFLRKL